MSSSSVDEVQSHRRVRERDRGWDREKRERLRIWSGMNCDPDDCQERRESRPDVAVTTACNISFKCICCLSLLLIRGLLSRLVCLHRSGEDSITRDDGTGEGSGGKEEVKEKRVSGSGRCSDS